MRLHYNGLRATLAADLSAGATTITFSAALTHTNGVAVPTITSPDFLPVVLLNSGAVREIVWITAYTSAATSATIVRGKEGSTGVTHVTGADIRNAPLAADFDNANLTMAAKTSGTDPALKMTQPDNTTSSSDAEMFGVYHGSDKTFWGNEWGAPRVRIPSNKSGDSVFKGYWSSSYTGVPFQLIKDSGTYTYQLAVHADGSVSMAPTSSPSSPTTGMFRFYFKTDGKLYVKNSAGLEFQIGLPSTFQAKTTTYTAVVGEVVQANASGGNFTVTLPSAPAVGALVTVQKMDSSANIVTIVPSGSGTIHGDANATIDTQWAGGTLSHVGSDVWMVVAQSSSVGATGATGPTGATGLYAPPANAQTGTSYTLVLSDAAKFVTMNNASASTLTVPPNSAVAFPVNTLIEGAQLGAGQVTITAGAGVTLQYTPGLKVAAQYGTFGLYKLATDTWLVYGRLTS